MAKKVFVGNLQPNETVDASNEANLLRHLNHPAIVKFYDSFIEADFFYIVTEYCEVLMKTITSLLSILKITTFVILIVFIMLPVHFLRLTPTSRPNFSESIQ